VRRRLAIAFASIGGDRIDDTSGKEESIKRYFKTNLPQNGLVARIAKEPSPCSISSHVTALKLPFIFS
jgi:hypothetical protein